MDYRRRWQETRLRKSRRRLLLGLAACLAALLVALPVFFHGNHGQVSIFTPLQPGLVHFAADGPHLVAVWSTGEIALLDTQTGQPRAAAAFDTPFPLLAEPLVFGDKAILGCDDGRVRELNLTTGTAAWEAPTGGAVRGKPVRTGNMILVGSDDGFLYCLDEPTGQILWRLDCGGKIGTEVALCGEPNLVVPTVDNGILGATWGAVTLPKGGEGVNGTVRWRLPTQAAALAPAVGAASGQLALAGTDEGHLYLLNPASGAPVGKLDFPGLVRCRPVLLADRVVAADCSGRVVAASLTGQLLWTRQAPGAVAAGLAAGGSAVYLATTNGEVLALRTADGRRLWRRRLPGPAAGSLQVTDNLILVGLAGGRICALRRPPEG